MKRTAFLATQLHYVHGQDVDYSTSKDGRSIRKSLIAIAMRTCDGHGTCTRSHRPHQLLQGIQPSTGRFFTIVAEPYPRKLCRRLVEAYAASIEERYERHRIHKVWDGSFTGRSNETSYNRNGPCRYGSRAYCCFRGCD